VPASSDGQPTDRNAVRRRALLDAGVGLLGAIEGGAVNVRAVCRSTGVTERYFYEIFGNRDEFVRAVFEDVTAQARAALEAAAESGGDYRALASAAVDAFVTLVIDSPDKGRVLMLAPYREQVLVEVGLGHQPEFFELVATVFEDDVPDDMRRLLSVELVGALTALFTQFLGGTLDVGRDRLVTHCVDMLVAAAARAS
jgi:AcrR family transcriptional regulator